MTDTFSLDVTGGGTTAVDLLVISGGHGGPGLMFQEDAPSTAAFSEEWWSTTVAQMISLGITAKVIILDACYSASMIDAFKPLGGIVVGFIPMGASPTITPEMWEQIYSSDANLAKSLITARLLEYTEYYEEMASLTGGAHGVCASPYAIYYPDEDKLKLDEATIDEDQIDEIVGLEWQTETELRTQIGKLTDMGAEGVKDFVPSL